MGFGSNKGSKLIDKQIDENLCKIYNEKDDYLGTGFLFKIPYPDQYNYSPVLISNSHIFIEKDLLENKTIKITFKNDSITKNLTITPERKIYNSQKYDIAIIGILKNDKVDNMLEYEHRNINFNKREIYILQYKKDKKGEAIYGKITNVDECEIRHNCNIEEGWDEGPILLLETLKVIGIHLGRNKENKYYYGTLLKDVIKEFYEKFKDDDNLRVSMNFEKQKYLTNKTLTNNSTLNKNSIYIIFRECGKIKNNAFIIECSLSEKLEDVITKYKNESKNNNSNIFKYNGNEISESDFELSVKQFGIIHRHTIFVIQK